MPLILHRLLCWFSVHDKARAQACFGPLAEFTGPPATTPLSWKHFPHSSAFAQLLYARMCAIWDLWQDHGNPAVPQLAYYIGIVIDAHIVLCLPDGPQSLVECYAQGRAPEQNTTLTGIWCHVHHHRLFEQLWHTELDSSFLAPSPSAAEKMLAVLKKGLPKPTSIRYIGTQLLKGLDTSKKLVHNLLYCGLLGAYPHATTIAPPHRRWELYDTSSERLFAPKTYITQAPPIELYALVAEHVIAGSEAHRPIAYLLRRTQFWEAHRSTIVHATNAFRAGKPIDKGILGGTGNGAKPYHPFETHTSKNVLFYLFKYVGIRKRLPRAVLAVLPKTTLLKAYKLALTNIVSFGIRLNILHAMGCSRRGCTFLKKTLFQPTAGTHKKKEVQKERVLHSRLHVRSGCLAKRGVCGERVSRSGVYVGSGCCKAGLAKRVSRSGCRCDADRVWGEQGVVAMLMGYRGSRVSRSGVYVRSGVLRSGCREAGVVAMLIGYGGSRVSLRC